MNTTKIPGGNSRRFSKRRLSAVATAVALVATGAISAQTFAGDGDGDDGPPPPPGEQPSGQPADTVTADGDLVLGTGELIQTSGSNFDPTVVSKFIPANAFQIVQGEDDFADTVGRDGAVCLTPAAGSAGSITEGFAPVELPDGARIKRVTFYGQDDDAVADIGIRLYRTEVVTPFTAAILTPISTRSTTVVDNFTTSGQQGDASVFRGADDLEELVGTPSTGGIAIAQTQVRFHTVRVRLDNPAGANHVLCGVKVDYQIPVTANPGTVFHPIDPIRAFDSRLDVLPQSGRLGPNQMKVIDITDGYDSSGVAIPAQANAVPSNATAIAYNITIAAADGPNFVAVTAGDAASFTASAINYTAGTNVANGSSVTLAPDQTIKLWGGDNTGSSHVLMDIVGYYAPGVPSNMAN